jgi:DNA-binding transcriptional ArsR family regulator
MLTRKIERIVRDLSQGIATTLGRATAEDLAEFSPRFFALLQQVSEPKSKAAPAPAKAAPRAPVAAPPARGPQPKGKAAKTAGPPSKARWGASSLKEAILDLLAKNPALRSEEIQVKLGSSPEATRVALTDLFIAKKIQRQGQARGTKYSVKKGGRAAKAPLDDAPEDDDTGVDAAALGRALEQATSKAARQAPAPEPIEVTPEQINTVRRQLAEHAAPMLVGELARSLELDKPLVKATLEEMLRRGLVERAGMGNAARYTLSSHAPATRSESSGGDRVLRRPPRGKWGAAENTEDAHSQDHDASGSGSAHD